MRATGLAIAALLLLGGCADPGTDPGAAPTASTVSQMPSPLPAPDLSVPLLPVSLELTGCLQLHTSFPFPVAAFSQLGFQLPPGFSFASSDGHTVDAFLAWWFCPQGHLNRSMNQPFADLGSMVAALPVVPPSDLAALDPRTAAVRLDLVPLTWILSSQLASNHLGRIDGLRGGYVESGDVRLVGHTNALAGDLYSAQAPASFGVFDVDVAIQAAPTDEPEGRYRLWLWSGEGDVTAYLDLHNAAGTALGSGAAGFRFAGDPEAGAPPATAGRSHVTEAVDVAVEHVVLR